MLVHDLLGVGNPFRQRQTLAGVRAPRHEGGQRARVDVDLGVELGVVVGAQRAPRLDRVVPVLAGRRVRTALQVGERGVVRGDHAGAGARLDGHVAHGHPRLHRQLLDGRAAVLEHVALPAAGADPRDDREDDVLRRDAVAQLSVHRDGHGLERPQRQRLRGEHVLDLGRADAERERAERAVRRGVTVTAHHRHPGLRQAELRPDDVHDALFDVTHRVQPDPELRAVLAERVHLRLGDRVRDRQLDVDRRDVVVLRRDGEVRPAHGATGQSQSVERLGARHLVDEVEVDVQEVRFGAGAVPDDVLVPNLFGECLALLVCHVFHPSTSGKWVPTI